MVVSMADVSAGHRGVQLVLLEHIDIPVELVQVVEQQQSSAMSKLMEPERSKTNSTSVGCLMVLDVCMPQLASLVGAAGAPPVPPFPDTTLASRSINGWERGPVPPPAPAPPAAPPSPTPTADWPTTVPGLLLHTESKSPKSKVAASPKRRFSRPMSSMAAPASPLVWL
jgi:hypothetical protein